MRPGTEIALGSAALLALLAVGPGADAQNTQIVVPSDVYVHGLPGDPAAPAPVVPPAPSASAIRGLLATTGVLVVEELDPMVPVGLANGARLDVAASQAYEPGREHQRLLGIRVALRGTELEGDEQVAYLDLHEVEALLRAMTYMEDVADATGASSGAAEARFVSLERFGVGTELRDGRLGYFVEGGRAAPVRAELSADAFRALRERLARARDVLFGNE